MTADEARAMVVITQSDQKTIDYINERIKKACLDGEYKMSLGYHVSETVFRHFVSKGFIVVAEYTYPSGHSFYWCEK